MNHENQSSLKHTASILASGSLWGTIGLFVRVLTPSGLTSLQLVFLRSVVTALGLLAYLLIFRREALKIRLKDIWVFAGMGILSVLFFSVCYFSTIQMADLSVAAVLLYTSPVFVMLLSLLLFREKLNARKILALCCCLGGCALVSGVLGGAHSLTLPALITGLLSGLGYSLYGIFGKFAVKKGYGALTTTFYTFLISAAAAIPFSGLGEIPAKCAAQSGSVLLIILLGIVTSVLPYLLYTYGLTGISASKAAIFASVEPVVAMLLGLLFFGEPLTLSAVAGMALVLGAVVLLSCEGKSSKAKGNG
ncbi:EamA family transporter [Christensenellaceae bacterium 44-20]